MFSESEAYYDAIYSWLDYEANAESLHELIGQRVANARTLLDVACGTGRHLEMFRRWYAVEGVDLDPAMIDVAHSRLQGIPLHVGDMRTFDLGRQFDIVTCLFSSIGAMTTFDDLVRALSNMSRHVAGGGLLIVEPWLAPDKFEADHMAKPIVASGPGFNIVRMSQTRRAGSVSHLTFHYLLAKPGSVRHFTEEQQLGLFTPEEYRQAFLDAGLSPEFDEVGLMGRGRWIAKRGS